MKKLISLVLFFVGVCYFASMFCETPDPSAIRGCPSSCFTTCPKICPNNNNTCCPTNNTCCPTNNSCCQNPCPCPAPCPVFCQTSPVGGSFAFSFDPLAGIPCAVQNSSNSTFSVSVAPSNGGSCCFRVTFLTPFCNLPAVVASSNQPNLAPYITSVTQSQFIVCIPTTEIAIANGIIHFVVVPGPCV